MYGDGLNSVRGQEFTSVAEISHFLEKIYGSSKTFHNSEPELAKIKQKHNETVIVYLNPLQEIEKKLIKAAQREKHVTNEDQYRND